MILNRGEVYSCGTRRLSATSVFGVTASEASQPVSPPPHVDVHVCVCGACAPAPWTTDQPWRDNEDIRRTLFLDRINIICMHEISRRLKFLSRRERRQALNRGSTCGCLAAASSSEMDVIPMCSIFQELQIVHDTGYFSALPSLEEYWQQVAIVFPIPNHVFINTRRRCCI